MNAEAIPTKTELKFNCPKCGQHILVSTDWVGLGMSCPSCQTRISIPSPSSGESPSKPTTPPLPTKPTIRIELPSKPAEDTASTNGRPVRRVTSTAVPLRSVTGNEPWQELVRHLENGALVQPEVLATALFHELTNVRRRLEEVERKLADQHPHNITGTRLPMSQEVSHALV